MHFQRLLLLFVASNSGKKYWDWTLPRIRAQTELSSTFVYDYKMSMSGSSARNSHITEGGRTTMMTRSTVSDFTKFAKTATNIAILSIFRATCDFSQFFVLLMLTFLMFHGYPCEYSFVSVDFSPVHPCWGDFQRAVWRSQSVVHHEKEPFHGSEALSSNLLPSTYISRPLEAMAMARCLELNWRFQLRKRNLRSILKQRFGVIAVEERKVRQVL